MDTQEQLWRDSVSDSPAIEEDARRGGVTSRSVNPVMMSEIQKLVSRLACKASQLITNETTNMAESWMHVRCKYDGGKVINRSQSGSWEHRCMGAGLQHNFGKEWGPASWSTMTDSPCNSIFSMTAKESAQRKEKDKVRKSRESVKEKRRKNKYKKNDNSLAACRAYRHDNQMEPDDVTDDVSPDILKEMKENYFKAQVAVTKQEAVAIEEATRGQAGSDVWKKERMKRITASKVGSIAKMKKTTKRSNRVKEMLYHTFHGNEATRYGILMEDVARMDYITYQREKKSSTMSVTNCGLFVSIDNPWLAASPDGLVQDPTEPNVGLLELKNPHSKRNMTLSEACNSSFCLKKEEKDTITYTLKIQHDYYFQVQCQLYCSEKEWCDFVVRTERDMHVQRIYRDRMWWNKQLPKFKIFYDSALLPELACPRSGKGPIREPISN